MTVLTITRPADTTQYGVGDVIASSTVAAAAIAALPVFDPGRVSVLHSITLSKANNNVTTAAFRAWILDSAPALTNGDNGALAAMTMAQVVAQFECTFAAGDVYLSECLADMHDTLALKTIVGASGAEVGFTPRKNIIFPVKHWLVLEARGAYTPASGEVFRLRLNLEPLP
jgi:hypothetical protein